MQDAVDAIAGAIVVLFVTLAIDFIMMRRRRRKYQAGIADIEALRTTDPNEYLRREEAIRRHIFPPRNQNAIFRIYPEDSNILIHILMRWFLILLFLFGSFYIWHIFVAIGALVPWPLKRLLL